MSAPDSPQPDGGRSDSAQPLLRIVRGNPDVAEVAALTALVASMAAVSPAAGTPGPTSRWVDRAALVGAPLQPGPGAWRASARPR